MRTLGYVRVSATGQNEHRQIIAMNELGIPKENIFMDKQSGKDMSRPGLQKLLSEMKSGDTIIVELVSRFARNTRDLLDLLELIDKLSAKGVDFVSQKEHGSDHRTGFAKVSFQAVYIVCDDIEYVFVFHRFTSIIMVIRPGTVDHYDTVFCIGLHHVKEIRRSEELYGTKKSSS